MCVTGDGLVGGSVGGGAGARGSYPDAEISIDWDFFFSLGTKGNYMQ